MPRLSLIVITRDEETAIGRCLQSASFADEIIVVDNGSRDKTLEIARSLGAKVVETSDWPGFGPQKNRALDASTGDWILSLDADEWIEPALAAEISAVLTAGDADAYEMPRRSRFCGRVVGHSGWWPDYVTRLWRRGKGRFTEASVHESAKITGRLARLKNPIEHDSIVSIEDARDKAIRYAKAAAEDLAARGKRSSKTKAFLRGAAAFLRTFVMRAGFLDGVTGWKVASYNTDYTYRKWARLAELNSQKE